MKTENKEQQKATQNSLAALNADPEVRAFVYQQLQELEPFLIPDTQVAVGVQDLDDLNDGNSAIQAKKVSIVIFANETHVEASGEATDIFHAVIEAKQKMIKTLSAYAEASVSSDRDEMIDNIIAKKLLH